jgi:hypothetical protein
MRVSAKLNNFILKVILNTKLHEVVFLLSSNEKLFNPLKTEFILNII